MTESAYRGSLSTRTSDRNDENRSLVLNETDYGTPENLKIKFNNEIQAADRSQFESTNSCSIDFVLSEITVASQYTQAKGREMAVCQAKGHEMAVCQAKGRRPPTFGKGRRPPTFGQRWVGGGLRLCD